jgi:hypothetical protein
MGRIFSRAFPPRFSHFMDQLWVSILSQIYHMLGFFIQLPLESNKSNQTRLDPKGKIVAGPAALLGLLRGKCPIGEFQGVIWQKVTSQRVYSGI